MTKAKKNILKQFGPYLTKRRVSKEWSLRDLARRAGFPHTNVYQFETQGKNPRLTELAQLAKAFRQSLLNFLKPITP